MNDLKTLYNANSNKDELAEVAEKLGIEDKSLAGILKELAGGMINAPTITQEELDSRTLTEERFNEITNSGIIKIGGRIYVLYSDVENTGNIIKGYNFSSGCVFINYIEIEAKEGGGGDIVGFTGYIVGQDSESSYVIRAIQV